MTIYATLQKTLLCDTHLKNKKQKQKQTSTGKLYSE